MKLSELFSIVYIFLLCTVGIWCLEITLDDFFLNCGFFPLVKCNASAAAFYQGRGTMVLNVGEELPQYIVFDEKCPPSTECLTRKGTGTWRRVRSIPTTYCQNNQTRELSGCYSVRERTYRFYGELSFYYYTRLCTIRVRPCDGTFEVCGPASNELKVSEIRTDSRYGYDTYEDEPVQISCRREGQRSAHNGKEERRHPSDTFFMIFGVILAMNRIDFF